MKNAPRSLQHHDLYRNCHGQNSEIRALLGEYGKPQRKAATAFRNFLLDEGFERSQFSVYARFVNGKEAFATRVNRIERHLPDAGDVQILNFTDRQYRDIVHFSDQGRRKVRENPQQLVMF